MVFVCCGPNVLGFIFCFFLIFVFLMCKVLILFVLWGCGCGMLIWPFLGCLRASGLWAGVWVSGLCWGKGGG